MKKKRILSLLMTIVMAMMLCMTAFAQTSVTGPNGVPIPLPEGVATDGDDYTYAFGLKKYMIVDKVATIPSEEFEFTIAQGTAVEGTGADTTGVQTNATAGPVMAGILPTATTTKVKFDGGSTTTDGAAGDGITNSADKKYATGKAYFDFSTVEYTKPGIYRYIISETAGSNASITYDTNTYTLDVVVGYATADANENGTPDAEETGTMSILSHAYYRNTAGTFTPTNEKLTVDNVTFPNTMTTKPLTISKDVTGTLGDKERYFKFTVNVAGTEGYTYSVDLTDATATEITDPETYTNPATITAQTDTVFYLKDTQSIVIKGLPIDTAYTVTEDSYATDGYITEHYMNGTSTKVTGGTTENETKIVATGGEGQPTINAVAYTNTKNATPLTGVIMQVLPFVVIILIAAGGFVLMMMSKRRKSQR